MMWLKRLFSRRRLYGDLSEEIREHLEEKIEELVAGGMSRREAAAAARREFGNLTLMEEDSRAVWRWAAIEDFFMDVRFGARMLRKNPGFAAVAIVTLALGIAANSTIFSMVSGWMLRPPSIKDPGRVVMISSTNPAKGLGWGWDRNPVSVPDFIAWREQSHAFEDMVASQISLLREKVTRSGSKGSAYQQAISICWVCRPPWDGPSCPVRTSLVTIKWLS